MGVVQTSTILFLSIRQVCKDDALFYDDPIIQWILMAPPALFTLALQKGFTQQDFLMPPGKGGKLRRGVEIAA